MFNLMQMFKGLTTPPRISWPLVLRVFNRNFRVFSKTWKTNILFNFIEPVFYLWAMGFGLGMYVSNVQGLSYINYLAPGLIASSAMFSTAYEMTYNSFNRMNYQKTFFAMLATPICIDDVVMGEILYGTFKGIIYGMVFFSITVLFGLVSSPVAILVVVPLLLLSLAFSVLSLIWTSIAPNYETFGYFFTLLISPMFFFSGIFFPIESIPDALRFLPWLTPLFHAVEIIRPLVLGQITPACWSHVLWLTGFVVITFPIPLVMIKNRIIR